MVEKDINILEKSSKDKEDNKSKKTAKVKKLVVKRITKLQFLVKLTGALMDIKVCQEQHLELVQLNLGKEL